MKKLLFILMVLASLNSYGQFFNQDFQSSTEKTAYTGTGLNQFDWLSSFGNAPSSIETEGSNNFFRFNKTGSSSAIIIRNTTLNNTSSVAVLKFRLRFTGSSVTTTQSDILGFFLGDATTSSSTTAYDENDTSSPAGVNVFGSSSLRVVESDASGKISYNNGQEVSGYVANTDYIFVSATNSFYPAADWNEIIVIANRTASTLPYKGPNGTNYNLAAGKQAVWVNTTQAVAAGSLSVNAELTTFNKFKVRIPSGFPNGTIDIDDISIYGDGSVLPVNFSSFTGKQVTSSVQLNWQTVSEQNNSHFNILRADKKGQFSKIGEVKGNQNTNMAINYTFIDFNPISGANYYKLQQVDLDNTVNEYKEIVAVNIDSYQKGNLMVNSSEDGGLNVFFNAEKENVNGKITITDVTGKLLVSKQMKVKKGHNELKLDQYLRKGVYIISLITEGKAISVKMVK